MKILVTGGTGFVGTQCIQFLKKKGHEVTVLTRKSPQDDSIKHLLYPKNQDLLPMDELSKFQAIINLAGANISSTKWNQKGKEQILESRLSVTKLLVESIANNKKNQLSYPEVFISASAVGFYGISQSNTYDEMSPSGEGFLASVARKWENQASEINTIGVRLVILRFGIVFGEGGMLKEISKPFSFHMGGTIGSGKQWISWIYIKDLIRMIDLALKDAKLQGVYNACTPTPITMKDLVKTIAVAKKQKAWLIVPSWVVHILFGEMAKELILNGQKVLPKRFLEEGFSWDYESLEIALREIYETDVARVSL